jgi:glycosyltransferase involved in cell wall biosynthesis
LTASFFVCFSNLRKFEEIFSLKKAIVSVTNDISTDQRVHKMCLYLTQKGFDVLLVGRKRSFSLPIEDRPYRCKRMKLLFCKGPFFYAEFNLRLFFFLLFRHADLLVSNDLDTLLPNFIIRALKRCRLVYDSHEYFTGVPELQHNSFARRSWITIERFTVPRLKRMITVSSSIAKMYEELYKREVFVVRNLPSVQFRSLPLNNEEKDKLRIELKLPIDKKLIILQGAGINIQRGAEEAVRTMQYLNGYCLLIIGGGDVYKDLKKLSSSLSLSEKIIFMDKIPFTLLRKYTRACDLGLSLDKDTSVNYRFSLPNKIFDYIHSGIPVLASPLVEVKKMIGEFDVGDFIENHDPSHIAQKIESMFANEDRMNRWKHNTIKASEKLCWENEIQILEKVYKGYAE